ncbi:MAG: hypothetical protein ACYTFG_16260, partial [Planctomycetota bacterium]
MAKGSSRRGRAQAPEEDYDDPIDEAEGQQGEGIMTALLIVSFGFIFLGIVLAWWTLHKNFDTPFLGVVQKAPNETVEAAAKTDFAKARGEDTGE